EDRLQRGQVGKRLHAADAGPQLALGLGATEKQLDEYRELGLADLEPLIKRMLPPRHAAAGLDHDRRALLAQALESVLDIVLIIVSDRVAVGFLVATGDDGRDREWVIFRRRLALLGQHPHNPALSRTQRNPGSARPARRFSLAHGQSDPRAHRKSVAGPRSSRPNITAARAGGSR